MTKKGYMFYGATFLVLLMIVSLIFIPQKKEKETLASIGSFIPIQSIEGPEEEAEDLLRIINHSGMSGADGRNHTHSNRNRDMWKVDLTEVQDEDFTLSFDFGKIVTLGEMWVWNYNGTDEESGEPQTEIGLKDVEIYYSIDNDQWKSLEGDGFPYRLEKADGSDEIFATNLANKVYQPIEFKGESARYVKIVVPNEPGVGNWSENQSIFGLSEVRFYHHQEVTSAGDEIIPVAVESKGIGLNNDLEFLISKTGLDQVAYTNDPSYMWSGKIEEDHTPEIIFNLGGVYPLDRMEFWNYNAPDKTEIGLKNINIYHSIDGMDWEEFRGENHPYELAQASGEESLEPTNLNDGKNSPIQFEGLKAQFIKISFEQEEGNWSSEPSEQNLIGLSHVRFQVASGIAVEPAYDWDELFSNYNGWTGADGTYSLELDKGENLFLFSDTYIGTVHPVSKQRQQANMLNNTIAILDGIEPDPTELEFTWTARIPDPNLFTPRIEGVPMDSWYWLQDGLYIDDYLYMFPILMINDYAREDNFQFAIDGVTMIKVPVTAEGLMIEEQEQMETPLFQPIQNEKGNFVFGGAIFDHVKQDGFIYVYGYKDYVDGQKDLIVARTTPKTIENFDQWEYWNGEYWTRNIQESRVILPKVSPELSVDYMKQEPFKGKYVAAYSIDTLSGYIGISVADHPYGPFSEPEAIYFVPEYYGKDVITYNAKAHPNLSREGELLISYNVNSTSSNGNIANGDIYRPRWVRMKIIE